MNITNKTKIPVSGCKYTPSF